MAHILVVDDDGDLRALLKTALERDGHQVSLLDRGGAGARPTAAGRTAFSWT